MKKVKALIMTAVLVVGFTSVAGAVSAAGHGPCDKFAGPCLKA